MKLSVRNWVSMLEASRGRRLEEGLMTNIRQAVFHFELGTYEEVLNKALVVERGLAATTEKKDGDGKKRIEPTGGFNGNGPPNKFNNRSFGVNANNGDQGNKLQCLRCGHNQLGKDCRWNTDAYFSCGEIGHMVADSPERDPKRNKGNGTKGTLTSFLGPNYGRVYQHQPKED